MTTIIFSVLLTSTVVLFSSMASSADATTITTIPTPTPTPTPPPPPSPEELAAAYAEEIKEYHFHVYFFQDNARSNKSAEEFFTKIQSYVAAGFFKVVPYKINRKPVGPHPVGSYEVWVPKEHFARAYSFFLLNRGSLSFLVHPLTKKELADHTDRIAWIGGTSFGLDTDRLAETLPEVPLQYPELGLGYSAPPAEGPQQAVPPVRQGK